MSDEGTELGVDLYRLLQAGQDYLPSVANLFGEVSKRLNSASNALSSVMCTRGADFPGGSPGPLWQPWSALEGDLWTAANTTDTTLRDTGAALVTTVHAYEKVDQKAADELERQCTEWGTPEETKVS